MKNQNTLITGKSITAEFIRKNMDELVERKTSILNQEKGYVYLHTDGHFQYGSTDQFGQSQVRGFGGYCKSVKEAIEQLQYFVDVEPYEFSNDLKEFI
jgi:hypothetical protein